MADGDAGLRRRKKLNAENLSSGEEPKKAANEIDKKTEKTLETNTFWLTRIVLLRYIGCIYCMSKLICNSSETSLILSHGSK